MLAPLSGVVLALDVDGVLLDSGRAGSGPWKNELEARYGVDGGAEIVLATNQEHRRVAFLRSRLAELMPIGAVLYSADLGYEKRHAPFFTAAAEALGFGARAEIETAIGRASHSTCSPRRVPPPRDRYVTSSAVAACSNTRPPSGLASTTMVSPD